MTSKPESEKAAWWLIGQDDSDIFLELGREIPKGNRRWDIIRIEHAKVLEAETFRLRNRLSASCTWRGGKWLYFITPSRHHAWDAR